MGAATDRLNRVALAGFPGRDQRIGAKLYVLAVFRVALARPDNSVSTCFDPVANVALRPAAGGLGLVVLPARGLMASLTKKLTSIDKLPIRAEARKEEGAKAFEQSSKDERAAIVRTFEKLSTKASLEERKKRLGEEAVEMLLEQPELEGSQGSDKDSFVTTESGQTLVSPSPSSTPKPDQPAPDPRAEFDEAAFQRDMEMAMKISAAEQAAYERGKAEAANGQP